MSLPYFPMFPSDFEAKTSHLTLAEDGAYNRLLRICWMTPGCTLPTDETWIMRRMRAVTDDDKHVVRTILEEFFSVENGRYSNAKLIGIWREANEAHEKRKNAGSKGGKAKALKSKSNDRSNATAMLKQPEPEPEPYITPSKEGVAHDEDDGNDDERKSENDAASHNDAEAAKKPKAGAGKRPIGEHAEPHSRDVEHAEGLGIDWRAEWPRFRDYHIKQETRTTERGWRASWRTWCRKAVEFKADRRSGSRTGAPSRRMDWNEAAAIAMAERAAPRVESGDLPEWLDGDAESLNQPAFRIIAGGAGST